MKQLLIYGANGYTGRKLALAARKRGIDTISAGRNAGAVAALARALGTEWRSFEATEARDVESGLEGVGFVLNAASPFSVTAPPLIAAATRPAAITATSRARSQCSITRRVSAMPRARLASW
jgi:short subunit dehydrogenase-like uncharacterized protein